MIDDQYQLATNPETAPEILRELSQSVDRAIRQAVAGNPNVPIEVLWELMRDFPHEVIANMANRPEIDPEVLWELSRHPDRAIRQAVAGNPNVPIELFWELAKEFAHVVVANPIFALITLTNPLWIQEVPDDHLIEILKQPGIPAIFFQAIVKHSAGYTKFQLLRQVSLPSHYVPSLLEELRNDLRLQLASADGTPIAVLEQLAQKRSTSNHWQYRIEKALARNIKTSPEILNQLLNSQSNSVRGALARREDGLTQDLITQLAVDPYPEVRKDLSANSKIDSTILSELISHPNPEVRKFAKQHPNRPTFRAIKSFYQVLSRPINLGVPNWFNRNS
jgi:hypothetical protein